jgi:hypothetical protein
MKLIRVMLLVALVAIVPACATDGAIGVSQDPKTGIVTIDPNGGTVGKAISIGQTAAPFVPPPFGTILTLGLAGASAILHIWQQARASNWKGAALATASGVQDVVGKLDAAHQQTPIPPAQAADMIKAAIDTAHDDHAVPQAIQNALTPVT